MTMDGETQRLYNIIRATPGGVSRQEVWGLTDYGRERVDGMVMDLYKRGYIEINSHGKDRGTDMLWVKYATGDDPITFTRRVRKFHSKKSLLGVSLPQEVLSEIGAFDGGRVTIVASGGKAVITVEP